MKRTTKLFIAILTITMSLLLSKNLLEKKGQLNNGARFVVHGTKTLEGDFILSDGLISPGNSPGKITVTGNFTMGSNGTYKCEIKDLTGSGSGHDQIDVSGNISLDGTLDIVLDGYTPNASNEFQIMKFDGSLSGAFNTINWPGTMLADDWQIDYGVFIPNRVTIYGNNSAIPIELLSFNLTERNNKVTLSWQTASERNSNYFEIEHGVDGKNYFTLDQIKAQGTSYKVHDYSFTHNYPVSGSNYYRLRKVDLDGHFTYSNVLSMRFGKEKISFYPNPATKTIKFNEDVKSVVIYDIAGKEILRKENIEFTLDITTLKSGIYIIEINKGEYRDKVIVK